MRQTRCQSLESFASAWPELIIACDVRGRGLLQTDGQTDITTALHTASSAFTGVNAKKTIIQAPRKQLCSAGFQHQAVMTSYSCSAYKFCKVAAAMSMPVPVRIPRTSFQFFRDLCLFYELSNEMQLLRKQTLTITHHAQAYKFPPRIQP